MDKVGWDDSVEFSLVSESQTETVIPEPINYDEGNGNIYERDSESKGFLVKKTNPLEFTKTGSQFLLNQLVTKGIEEDVVMEKKIKDPNRLDEEWRTATINYINLSELEFNKSGSGENIAKTKAGEGGLKKLIDSKKKDVFDLTSILDSNGNAISELEAETITLPTRAIFLRSELSVEDGTRTRATVSGFLLGGLNARSVPFQVDINSDSGNIDFVLQDTLSAENDTYASLSSDKIGNCWLTASETDKQLTLNGKVKATITDREVGTWTMDIVIYSGGSEFILKEVIPLTSANPNILGNVMQYTFSDYILDISKGDSVAIGFLSDTDDGIEWEYSETSLVVTEDSVFAPTTARCLTYEQVINRLLLIITGTDELLISDLLTTGVLSTDLLTSGFWVRGFPNVVTGEDGEERKIQFNVSLNEVFDHIEALHPKAWWIEKQGDTEYLRLELYSYTQQNFVGIPFFETVIDQFTGKETIIYIEASDIKRKVLKKNFYSIIEVGSSKGGNNYEEVDGLQSINGKANFSTINKKNESKYSKLSPFALGDIDIEIPRRKPYDLFPNEDTRFDSRIMVIRSKLVGNTWVVKSWGDDFESAPTGIYRVDTAYNLDISPARLLLNHSANINAGLYHYPLGSIVFSSSNCNSSYKSKKSGEDLLEEDGAIPHSRLSSPTIRPFSVDCTAKVSQEIEDRIIGKTNEIPNWFGLVAINTGVTIELFRLIESDVNKEGKHKLIEAYIT